MPDCYVCDHPLSVLNPDKEEFRRKFNEKVAKLRENMALMAPNVVKADVVSSSGIRKGGEKRVTKVFLWS